MNVRALLHAIQTGLAAIVAGAVIFVGMPPDVTADVVAAATLGEIVIGSYLASTTVGESAIAHMMGSWETEDVGDEPDEPRAA